ncbi:uncharacterized protein F4817DRAFT_312384 [Daldinia loculata]|uniref:uncharacterized protein n=1 Tax=Daldinia loculata TaxID=103429 RepID=UPI0020C395CF|nr:uncharacterized protein F4817DRAFT_312384 [Daldinia loculata]KAI1651030.1 hypothetical protein F4817DRAFT_312384 [Daldinia loculata]
MADREGAPASGLFTPGLAARVVELVGVHMNLDLEAQPASQDVREEAIQVFRQCLDELDAGRQPGAEPAPELAGELGAEPVAEPVAALPAQPAAQPIAQPVAQPAAQPAVQPPQPPQLPAGALKKHEAIWGNKILPSLGRNEMEKRFNAADTRFFKKRKDRHQSARRDGTTYLEIASELFWRWKKEGYQPTAEERVYLENVCGVELTNAFDNADGAVLAKPASGQFYYEVFSTWYRVVV